MYAHCLFCARDLGRNEALEHFPVGRRLAHDAARGRLWVICTSCERWNLTPLEERWEAIDEAERLFRVSRQRLHTDNIGLARVADGTDIIRIGNPQRPEMAAWRYGDQFRRRRRRFVARGLGTAAAVGGALLLQPTAEVWRALALVGGIATGWGAILTMAIGNAPVFTRRALRDDEGQFLIVTPNELSNIRLVQQGADGWALRVPYQSRRESNEPSVRDWSKTGAIAERVLTGRLAERAMQQLLPLLNGNGASDSRVKHAVAVLEEWGGPGRALSVAATHLKEWSATQTFGDSGALAALPVPVRLALEMAAHEEQERRALAGELAELEEAWRDAEQIASIADDLELPSGVRAALARLKARG